MKRISTLTPISFLFFLLLGVFTSNAQSEVKTATIISQTANANQASFSSATAAQLALNDNVYTTTQLQRSGSASNVFSQVLSLTGFGFAIPANTAQYEYSITGVQITIDRKASVASRIATPTVRLIVNGNIVGNNKGNTSALIPATDETVTYGGIVDMFGLTLTTAQVNSSNFGVAFQFQNTSPGNGNNPTTLSLDFISIEVFYTTRDLTVTPVTFAGFSGRKTSEGTVLTWKVGGEVNVSHYDVERSSNGNSNFSKIGSVTATGDNSYSFTDAGIANGTVFYRIKNVDNDGKFSYSTIIQFRNGSSLTVFRVVPTLATSSTLVQHPVATANTIITLTTVDGKLIRNLRLASGSNQTTVSLSGLQAGVYLVKWTDGSSSQMAKIVKQ